jgi:hypothetical protein
MTFIGFILLMVKSGVGHEREIVSSTRTFTVIPALICTPIFFAIQVAFLYVFLVFLSSHMLSPLYIFYPNKTDAPRYDDPNILRPYF